MFHFDITLVDGVGVFCFIDENGKIIKKSLMAYNPKFFDSYVTYSFNYDTFESDKPNVEPIIQKMKESLPLITEELLKKGALIEIQRQVTAKSNQIFNLEKEMLELIRLRDTLEKNND
jgi:hypothetical protein